MALSEQATDMASQVWCHSKTENLHPHVEVCMVTAMKFQEMLDLMAEAKTAMDLGGLAFKRAWIDKYEAWMDANNGAKKPGS